MSAVQLGDEIAIHYRLHGPAGEVIAASAEGEPVIMRVGSDDVIPGLSIGVVGMELEEIKSLHFTPEQAFGDASKAIERVLPKNYLPPEVKVGDRLRLRQGDACLSVWVQAEQNASAWLVTTKHPYAGMKMAMTLKVIAHKS